MDCVGDFPPEISRYIRGGGKGLIRGWDPDLVPDLDRAGAARKIVDGEQHVQTDVKFIRDRPAIVIFHHGVLFRTRPGGGFRDGGGERLS